MSETPNPTSPSPTEDQAEQSHEHLVGEPGLTPKAQTRLLPGVAGISIYMLIMAMLNAFASMRGAYGQGRARVGVLIVCALMIAGIFGLLRMRRWGWALVAAGALLLSLGDLYVYIHLHIVFYLIRAGLGMVFFLYLVRPEVRTRLR